MDIFAVSCLEADIIMKNPCRPLAKLLLNRYTFQQLCIYVLLVEISRKHITQHTLFLHYTFWGKFAQRFQLPRTTYMRDPKPNFCSSSPMKCQTVILSMNNCENENDFLEDGLHTNMFIATFITCWARLKLLDLIHLLWERVMYFDTDSVIYVEDSCTMMCVHLFMKYRYCISTLKCMLLCWI